MKPTFFAKTKGKSGEIYIYSEIGDGWFGGMSAASFADALKSVGKVDTLDVYINSPGGNLFDGIAIYNQLARFEARKIVHVDALAASIASVIAMAGDTIKMAANAQMMIHDPWGVVVGTSEDMRRTAETMDQCRDTILDTYVARAKCDRDECQKWMSDETWMRASTALERGFCDEIEEVEQAEPMDSAFTLLAKFKNTPPELMKRSRAPNLMLARMGQSLMRRGIPAKT